jgi:hypothetical protein
LLTTLMCDSSVHSAPSALAAFAAREGLSNHLKEGGSSV